MMLTHRTMCFVPSNFLPLCKRTGLQEAYKERADTTRIARIMFASCLVVRAHIIKLRVILTELRLKPVSSFLYLSSRFATRMLWIIAFRLPSCWQ